MKSDLMTDSLTKKNSRTFYRINVIVFLIKVQVHINFSALCEYISSIDTFLGAFTKFGKATISFVISVLPSAWKN